MKAPRLSCALALALPLTFALACGKRSSSSADPAPSSALPLIAPSAPPSASAGPTYVSCGDLDCRAYDDLAVAFAATLESRPLVVAIGEAHPKKGIEVDGAAKRFGDAVLPTLDGRVSDLLLELMSPAKGCAPANAGAGKQLATVATQQAKTAADDYVVLGKAAQQHGVKVSQLHPTCDELSTVAKSKSPPEAILLLIAKLSEKDAKAALAAPGRDGGKMVVIFGGAFHGEPDPPAERADFSFAKGLSKEAKGRYVSVHLFVREYIDDSWSFWPWYAQLKADPRPDKVLLFRTKPQQYVIVTAAGAGAAKKGE
jgi:hypothetical protein